MAFYIEQPKSYDDGNNQSRLFKDGVKFSYFKADERRPITFRILPAFEEHDNGVDVSALGNGAGNYVPAVTMAGGQPIVADWLFNIRMSRPFIKGSFPVVSRTTLVERNADGSLVHQEDPLSQVYEFCRANKDDWGYVVFDQGEWGKPDGRPAKLPKISSNYVMNVVTYDDERPGAKLAVISSFPAIMDLAGGNPGQEGFALRQTTREISAEELARNPSAMFELGDITDPNDAPVFKFLKKAENGKTSYRIMKAMEIDPQTGRQRVQKSPVSPEDLYGRVDLAHPETYVNIPTPEEQVKQLVRILCGRNGQGLHEADMLRAACPDYASLVPQVPTVRGSLPTVQGFTPPAGANVQAPIPAPTQAPVPTPAQPVQAMQPAFSPAVKQTFAPAHPARPAPTAAPAFVPARPAPVPAPVPAPTSAQPPAPVPAAAPQGVPGEASGFDESDWLAQWNKSGA